MSKTAIMTLRLSADVRRGVERLASQLGYKPAHLGARLVEEGLRRRRFPQIELRDTASGRVAYLKGTRLAVHWIIQQVREGLSAAIAARDFEISTAQVNAALAYGEAFSKEIQMDIEEADSNRRWVELQDSAWRAGRPQSRGSKSRIKPRK